MVVTTGRSTRRWCLVAAGAAAALLAGPLPAAGQQPDWSAQFGTAHADEADGVALGPAGDVYVAGFTLGALGGQTSAGSTDAFVRRYDPAGDEVWTRQFGGSERDFAREVATDAAGDVYVVGETHGALPGQRSAGGFDAFVRKYDSAGTEVWTRQFGGGGGDAASGVAAGADGIYVVGSTGGALPGQETSGDFDAFVRRYDTAGTEVWTRQFGTHLGDGATGVGVDDAGNVWVVGNTADVFAGQSNAGGLDAFVRLYDAAGTEVWTRQFGSVADDYALDAAAHTGGVAVVGSVDAALPGVRSAGDTDGFVRLYDLAGETLWTQQFGDFLADDAWAVAADAGGGITVAGTTERPSTEDRLPGVTAPPTTDAYIRRYDAAGGLVGTRRIGTEGRDVGLAVAVEETAASGSGAILLAGSTTGTLPGQRSSGNRDAYVVRLTDK